ncbi:hypothetical protein MLD38_013528 [Melastoma candidum]|uniref:Uncharacterized protein n=1 Tax=Melastoma candidum TaxID=119954 RepID=A0ACB9R9H3_9MYRT|nr:hypothetical protein MLD38_013528 [Melastoma candidum]
MLARVPFSYNLRWLPTCSFFSSGSLSTYPSMTSLLPNEDITKSWPQLPRKNGTGKVSPEELYAVIKKHIERTLIRTVSIFPRNPLQPESRTASLELTNSGNRREVLISRESSPSTSKGYNHEQRRSSEPSKEVPHENRCSFGDGIAKAMTRRW